MSNFYPITFSIPEEKIVDEIPTKTKILADIIPGDLKTYIYETEEEYYDEYKKSVFAITKKKAGWDCLRHYEIIANGCIPYFENIEDCPENTLFLFPKELIYECNALYQRKDEFPNICNETSIYLPLINKLLDYLRTNLTTRKIAEYILRKSGKTFDENMKILFLSRCAYPDYLRCLTLHGFKTIFGKNCHDWPKINHIYKNSGIKYETLYGKGMTYTQLLEQDCHDETMNDNLENDIENHRYDLIVYGNFFRRMPYYNFITKYYKPSEIILLYGEDKTIREDLYGIIASMKDKGHHIFIREW